MAKTTQENAARLDLYNNDRILDWILKKLEKESNKKNSVLQKNTLSYENQILNF